MEQIQKTSSEQKLNELEYDILRYKENRMNPGIIDEQNEKTFKMPRLSIKYQGSIITNNFNDMDVSNIVKNILSNGIIRQDDTWNEYNRVYLHFLVNQIEILFKIKRRRRFEEERRIFNYEQIAIRNNRIIIQNEDMKITICWSDPISMTEEETIDKYILIEIPYGVETKYTLHSIKDVINEELITMIPNRPNILNSSISSSTNSEESEEIRLMRRHEREREVEMEESPMSEENEPEIIDLTIIKNLGMIDLTMEISEEESVKDEPVKEEPDTQIKYERDEYEPDYEPEPNFYGSPIESPIDLSYDSEEHQPEQEETSEIDLSN